MQLSLVGRWSNDSFYAPEVLANADCVAVLALVPCAENVFRICKFVETTKLELDSAVGVF